MIDKQKLIQWVDEEHEIASGSHSKDDKPIWIAKCKAEESLMYRLKRLIEFGKFDVEEEVAHERTTASSASAART